MADNYDNGEIAIEQYKNQRNMLLKGYISS
jgi:hypothetical protein